MCGHACVTDSLLLRARGVIEFVLLLDPVMRLGDQEAPLR